MTDRPERAGSGMLVLAAAELAEQGMGAEEILASLRRTRETLDIWFCLDTLEYLRKGGRIGAAQAVVGTALKIKPILTFGVEIAPVGRVRTHSRAIERMVDYLRELKNRGASDWIVQHAQGAADAEHLVEAGRELFGTEPTFCTEVGPVLGAHLGAGVLVGGMTRPPRTSPALDPPAGADRRRGEAHLLGDLDQALHAQTGVLPVVLGVHEADLDIPAGSGSDRLLLKSAGGERARRSRRAALR